MQAVKMQAMKGLRVAVYCRVSTDSSDQANSLASQESYFKQYIDRNPEWDLAQVYVDTGITGTSTRKRAAFNRMIGEAMSGRFNLILTKEISRFARNTLDSIYYTRKLKEKGVGVIFMNDNINTLDPDAELRLTIMSSIAQEESRKTSERVKWGQKRRMEQGVVFGRDMLGYDVRNGRLYINKEGAETVRLIFHKFVNEGKGTHIIARELQEAGIPTSTYMKQWSNTVILRILRNEKVAGDLIQKKTITPSYLTHEKKYNRGEEEFVILRNHHEPIVSRELFDRAQEELARRSPCAEQKAKHSNRYCFSGKIKCGVCGCSYVSRTKKRKDGSIYKAWRCYRAANHGSTQRNKLGEEGGCHCPSVNEEDLQQMLQEVVQSLHFDKKALAKTVGDAVAEVMQMGKLELTGSSMIEGRMEALTAKQQGLIELFLSKDITKDDFQSFKSKYENEINDLRQKREKLKENDVIIAGSASMEAELRQFISELAAGHIWDDTFYRNLTDTIIMREEQVLIATLNHLPCKWIAEKEKNIQFKTGKKNIDIDS